MKERKKDNSFSLLKELFGIANVRPIYFVFPTVSILIETFFEAVSVALLIPLVKGLLEMNFGFVNDLPVLKLVIARFPGIFKGNNLAIFIMLVGITFTAVIMRNIFRYLSGLNVSYLIRNFSNNLRKEIFKRYLSFGKMFFDRENAGYLNNVLMDFTSVITTRIIDIRILFARLFMLVAYLILMFFISWKLSIFAIVVFLILYYSLAAIIRKIEMTSKNYADLRNTLSRKILNVLTCIPLVKFYSAEDKEGKDFVGISNRVRGVELSIDKKKNFIMPAQEIMAHMVILLLISGMAFLILTGKSKNVSGFVIYFYLLKRATNAIGLINDLKGSIAVISGPAKEILKVFEDKGKFFITEGEKQFDGLEKSIEFKNLTFSYRENIKVLDSITLTIEKGKMIALVGSTGAGKTTLINLILRFYESPPSSIFIDGTDIREFESKSLRSHMALVSQDILLFNDTLRKNITYGLNREISDEELLSVVKKARLYDFVAKLPEGLDAYIGDRGVQLSGGEKQRVSIARALLKDVDILILDEATSSLDTETERIIQEAISEVIKGKTVIVIAHRLSTIKHADKIVVIENGRVVEEGSLDKLLEKKGRFYGFWEKQKF